MTLFDSPAWFHILVISQNNSKEHLRYNSTTCRFSWKWIRSLQPMKPCAMPGAPSNVPFGVSNRKPYKLERACGPREWYGSRGKRTHMWARYHSRSLGSPSWSMHGRSENRTRLLTQGNPTLHCMLSSIHRLSHSASPFFCWTNMLLPPERCRLRLTYELVSNVSATRLGFHEISLAYKELI